MKNPLLDTEPARGRIMQKFFTPPFSLSIWGSMPAS
jgi:hypothetical protein